MTVEDAARELGLAPGAPFDRAAIRRAYLSGLKERKPEIDPDGFQRLRAAYELLTGLFPLAEAPPAGTATPEQAAAEPWEPAGDVAPADHLATYRQRIDAIPASSWGQRAAVARQAYAATGKDPAARELLLEQLPDPGATAEIIAVLLEGVEAGDPLSVRRLLVFSPRSMPEDTLALIRREGGAGERLMVAVAHVIRDEPEAAVQTLSQALAGDGGAPFDPSLFGPALGVVLRLHRRLHVPAASRAFAAVRLAMGGGLDVREASPDAAVVFGICADLDALPDLPRELRQAVAGGILDDDLSLTRHAGTIYERTYGGRLARHWRRTLKKKAPTIGPLITWGDAADRRLATLANVNWIVFCLAAFPMLAGGRCLLQTYACNERFQLNPIQVERLAQLEKAAEPICREPPNAKLCGQIYFSIRSARQDGQCHALQTHARAVDKEALEATTEGAEAATRLTTFAATLCPL